MVLLDDVARRFAWASECSLRRPKNHRSVENSLPKRTKASPPLNFLAQAIGRPAAFADAENFADQGADELYSLRAHARDDVEKNVEQKFSRPLLT
jgi:hypothetical protein